jgi:uncharacterized protein (TIGR03435 family)
MKWNALAIALFCGAIPCDSVILLPGATYGHSTRITPVSREAVPQSQSTPSQPAFDVASVKLAGRGAISPSNPMYVRPGNAPGSLEARNANVAFLISNAYGVKMPQIYNDPSWVQSDGYDISAKTDLTSEEAEKIGPLLDERSADMNLRLQSLLEDSFHLQIHRETRQLPIFILTVAKTGLKLQPPGGCVERGPYRRPEPGQPSPKFCGTYSLLRSGVGWKLTGLGITMKDLVGALAFQQLPNLIEQTGYTEPFNAILEWTPDSTTNPPVTLPDDAAPSLSTALQEQLGIKLESGKGPVQVLVVDHVERPTEN